MNINNLVRPNILKLTPYSSARGENTSGILLDANENPFGSAAGEFNIENLNRYPDPNQSEIRNKLAGYLGIPSENLFCGVGSDEIIDLLIRIFCEPGSDEALIIEPTYGMYEVACAVNNIKIKPVTLNGDFQIDLAKTIPAFGLNSKLLFLCSPNNPTGNLLKKEDILSLAKSFNGIVVVDEAYIEFCESESLINEVLNYNNLVVLRTFSKAWGLAGARCGYCAANNKIIDLLFKIKAPYNINRLTSAVILSALENREKKEKFVSIINQEKNRIVEKLRTIEGVEEVFSSDANYILFRCRNSKKVMDYLTGKGIIIRDRSRHPMLKDCLRISVGAVRENDLFLTALWRALCEISS